MNKLPIDNYVKQQCQEILKTYFKTSFPYTITNPIHLLNYLYQHKVICKPYYRILFAKETIPCNFVVACNINGYEINGEGKSKKIAKTMAAQFYLDFLLDNDKTQNRIQELEEKHFSVNEPCTVLNEMQLYQPMKSNNFYEFDSNDIQKENDKQSIQTSYIGSEVFCIKPQCSEEISVSSNQFWNSSTCFDYKLQNSEMKNTYSTEIDTNLNESKNINKVSTVWNCDSYFDPFSDLRISSDECIVSNTISTKNVEQQITDLKNINCNSNMEIQTNQKVLQNSKFNLTNNNNIEPWITHMQENKMIFEKPKLNEADNYNNFSDLNPKVELCDKKEISNIVTYNQINDELQLEFVKQKQEYSDTNITTGISNEMNITEQNVEDISNVFYPTDNVACSQNLNTNMAVENQTDKITINENSENKLKQNELIEKLEMSKNPCQILHEKCIKYLKLIPRYHVETIKDGFRCKIILGSHICYGEGQNKKLAKINAAINLLKILEIEV